MNTTPAQRWHIDQACRILAAGGVIAYPTEAVYGLGCDPLDGDAVMRILDIKQRQVRKGLILIASGLEQLAPYLDLTRLAPERFDDVLATWPGPVTWLIPATRSTPWWLTGEHDTLAVRITRHPLARALCDRAGHALVSTSANRAGRPPARNALQTRLALDADPDYILNGATGAQTRPSEIRDARSGEIIRRGQ